MVAVQDAVADEGSRYKPRDGQEVGDGVDVLVRGGERRREDLAEAGFFWRWWLLGAKRVLVLSHGVMCRVAGRRAVVEPCSIPYHMTAQCREEM